jgi:hypothetical protein
VVWAISSHHADGVMVSSARAYPKTYAAIPKPEASLQFGGTLIAFLRALFDEIGMQMNIDTFTPLSLRLTLKTASVVGTTRS